MKLNVPYYSQKIDVKDTEWKNRACGMICLKMILDFSDKDTPALDELIKIGVEIGAYGKSGWIHQGLINVATNLNLSIYRKEFKSNNPEESQVLLNQGINELLESLENGKPVLVSAVKKFKEPDKFHMVLLVGFEGNKNNLKGFYYHDPDAETVESGKNLVVSIETFQKYWRKMAIFTN